MDHHPKTVTPPRTRTSPYSLRLPSKKAFIAAAIDTTSGVAGGIASVLVGQPLDTVKVKMQTFPTTYRNAFDCFIRTYKQQGLFYGLYAGSSPALVANIAENSILFLFYGICQQSAVFISRKNCAIELNTLENAFCGSVAAIFSSLALCPTELIKCRMQAMHEVQMSYQTDIKRLPGAPMTKRLIGPYGLIKKIIAEQGFRGMFQGIGPTIAREVPGYFFFFGGYELSRSLLTPMDGSKNDLGVLSTLLCGGLGGVSFWLVVFPIDVVKSRVQVATKDVANNRGTLSTILLIFKNEGFTALYRGMTPNLMRTFIATGALFLAYEHTKANLNFLCQPHS